MSLRATSLVARLARALRDLIAPPRRPAPPVGEPPARITYLDTRRRRDVLVMAAADTPPPTRRTP